MKDLRNYINDKRGLSVVVVTLIMILLVLVAVGIIWAVVRNIVETGTEQIDLAAKCLEIEVTAIALVNTTDDGLQYDLTLSRGAGGGDIGGVKVVLFNDANENSGAPSDFGAALAELETNTQPITLTSSVLNADRIEVTPYFTGASGNEQLCSITSTFNF